MGVLAAERIKLTSTRSPWWCSAIIVALGLGFAALIAAVNRNPKADSPPLSVTNVVGGVSGFGVLVLMILASLAVTSEYRFGTIKSTFLATPARDKVLTTKALMIGVYGAVLIGVLTLLAFGLAKIITGSSGGSALELSSSANARAIYGPAIYAFLAVLLAVGIGVLVRQTAAAISLIILWPTVIESLLSAFGSFGRNVGAFMPFANASHFYSVSDGGSTDWHWGPWGSLLYFAAFVAIIFGAALFMVNKRDA
ncbi:MAG: transporter permease [Nocardia sp.]|uniref:ABC transporter permease n=1 Tax=Nocardia sp. TaxID=1821 RepID=UPI002601EE2B|nr:ABC transporter permease [Nocardia sp.]MCU1648671.1 transporter permease [Nocardia sp.]